MHILRKYGIQTTIYFPLIDFGATDYEATPVSFASGDTTLSKAGTAFGNATNDPTHVGGGIYALTLTAAEMQAAIVIVKIIDQTNPKAWEDQALIIDTYGNASAEHAFDLDTATQSVNIIGGTGARSITLHTQTTGAVAVGTVTLSVYDSDNTSIVTIVTTDSNGDVTVSLDDGTYKVRAHKSAYTATSPQTITVTADATKNITIDPVSASPSEPDGCVITGGVDSLGGGDAMDGVTVYVWADTRNKDGEGVVVGDIGFGNKAYATTTTISSGVFSIETKQGARTRLKIDGTDIDFTFTAPASATITLGDALDLKE